jgi:alkylation response protein AidB-like acyl-CoA dehydrogenase
VIFADSDEVSALREAATSLLGDRSSSSRVRAVVDRGGPPDPELDRAVAEADWFGIEIPEQFGGAGGEFTDMLVILEAMGAALAATTLVGSAVLCAGAIVAGGTAEQHRRWLPDFAAGVTRGAVALPGVYEPRAGERVIAADLVGGDMTADGRVSHVLGAAGADLLVVVAETADSAASANRVVLVVPAAVPGVTIEPQPTTDATRHLARISLDHVRVPACDVLAIGPEAATLVESIVNRAALAVAADSLGQAGRVVTMTVDYAKQREQFGRPIGSFQAVKHRAADMFVGTETARALTGEAGRAVAADPAGSGLLASMAKQYACAAAADIAGAGLQLHGGIGYTWEHDLHLILKRAKLNEALFGGLSWHRRRAAALLLSDSGLT